MCLDRFSYQNKYFNIEGASLPTRQEIEEKYKWNLSDIYSSDEQWEQDFLWVETNLNGYNHFAGKLNTNSGILLKCFRFDDSIGVKLERLYLYAMLEKDSDMRVYNYQAMDDRIKSLYSKVSAISSFIKPELLEIPDDKLLKMIDSLDELKIYKHTMDNLLRTTSH